MISEDWPLVSEKMGVLPPWKNSAVPVGLLTEKMMGTLKTGLPLTSYTFAVIVVQRELASRGGFGTTTTLAGRALPIATVVEQLPLPLLTPPPPPGEGDAEGATAGPPDTTVIEADPERLSETKFTRTTPSLVFPWGSMWPRVLKNCATVPSGTANPAGTVIRAEITETSPKAAMKGGFGKQAIVDPGGAVKSALAQVSWVAAQSRSRPLRASIIMGRNLRMPNGPARSL
jgi:hypothetical protein